MFVLGAGRKLRYPLGVWVMSSMRKEKGTTVVEHLRVCVWGGTCSHVYMCVWGTCSQVYMCVEARGGHWVLSSITPCLSV